MLCGVVVGLGTFILGAAVTQPGMALGLAVVAMGAGTIAIQRSGSAKRLYERWARLARVYAAGARLLIAWISYQTVLLASRGGGRDLQLRRPPVGGSSWSAVAPPGGGSKGYGAPEQRDGPPQGGLGSFVRWNLETGRLWALPLAPFLLLLRLLSDQEKSYGGSPAREIYSLY